MKFATKIIVSAALLLAAAPAFAHGMGGGMGGSMNSNSGPSVQSSKQQSTETQNHGASISTGNAGHVGPIRKLVLQSENRELTRQLNELQNKVSALRAKGVVSGPELTALNRQILRDCARQRQIMFELAKTGSVG
jgi:hypothetical protein